MAKTLISPKQFFFFNKRFKLISNLFYLLLLLLLLKITILQIIEGEKYTKLAYNNRFQYIPIQTYRGEIFFRDFDPESELNEPLVSNVETLGVYLLPIHLRKTEAKNVIKRLSDLLNFNYTNKIAEFTNRANYYEPFLVADKIKTSQIARIAEKINDFPGVYWEPIYKRKYPMKNFASHIVGFVGKINKRELKLYQDNPQYHRNSILGKMGIEKYYDKELRGKEGILLRVVDAKNRIKKSSVIKEPEPGYNLVLTLDKRIQQIVESAMKHEVGSAIVMDPTTGEILAMVSKPDFDPNIFIEEDYKKIVKLNRHPKKPFLNRAIQAKYPPGSVFKIVTASAGLEEEVVSPQQTFLCRGYYKFENDDRVFHCTGIHGFVNIFRGIEFSCNVYFFNLSYYLGSRKLMAYAHYYGYGEKSGIDLPGEIRGFLPTHKWKKKVFGEPWYDGDTINMGIGQGFILSTVLQVADMMCGVANNGLIYQPHLLRAAYSAADGKLIYKTQRKLIHNVPVSEKNLNIIKRGLHLVTVGGTARYAGRFAKISFAGKTSTSQNTFGQPHAWFSCYAPYNSNSKRRKLVVTVFIENGGGGGEAAAPIAVAILNAVYFNDDPVAVKKKIKASIEKIHYERYLRRLKEKQFMEGGGGGETDIQF